MADKSTPRFSVRCWPFGEGESEGNQDLGEPEFFDSRERAILRGIEEIADWTDALLDPANGDAPSDCEEHGSLTDYARNGARQAFREIIDAANSVNPELSGAAGYDASRMELFGPSNEVVVIEEVAS